tara:strand:- start:306 stop:524 length:219 start_codon:yes stop_codon:yes gene_type:complete
MLKTEKNGAQISSFEYRFDEEVRNLKNCSIRTLIDQHPTFFKNTLKFHDWESSMGYLMENKEVALRFWSNDR